MKSTLLLCFGVLSLINSAMSQNKIGIFDNNTDIGNCKNQGFANFQAESQTYTIGGSGANMWADDDQFHYLWTTLQGDFILRAEVAFLGGGVDPHRKAGWIIKNNLDANTEIVNASTHGDGLTALQYRKAVGGETAHTISKDSFPDVIQLERRGNTYTLLYDTTKFKLIEQGTFWHSDTPNLAASISWGNTYPRITTWGILAKHHKNAKPFLVMNTHFSGRESYVSNTASLNMRKRREIAGSMPAIFMGDFNLAPASDAHQLFCGKAGPLDLRGDFIDGWQALHKSEQNAGTGHSYTGSKSQARIDWILSTPEFVVDDIDIIYDNVNGLYPSDHYPVLAELKFD